MAFLNRCIWTAASAGTGDFVVSAAAQNGYTPAQCLLPAVVNGSTYHYFATNGTEHEEGDGAYNTATNTLARTTIRNSSNSHAKVTFSSAPVVTMGGPVANDIVASGATFADVVAPAATGVQATDTANLQAAINATPNGGWLFIPRGTYQINVALSITQSIRITGAGVFETFTGNSLPDTPWAVPYLYGTVIVQNTAATDGITINGALVTAHLSDFGVMFDTSIWFSNTGNGISVTAPVVGGQTYHQTSMVKSTWRDLTVFGHDGNHYGFHLLNSMVNTFDTLRAYGGGVMSFTADNPGVNYGNAVVTHAMGVLMSAGTAHGFLLQGSNTGTFGAINLMTFIRPQCNSEDLTTHFPTSTKPTASQYLWYTDQSLALSGASYVRDVRVISPDLEGDVSGVTNPVQFNKDTFVDASGTMPQVAYLTTPDYNSATLPTAAVQGGAGTGATASINGGPPAPSDLTGVIILHTGTSPGSGAFTDLVQVTFGTPLFRTPRFIMLYSIFASDSTPFMVHNFSTTGFMVMTALGSAIGDSKDYQIAWRVEP